MQGKVETYGLDDTFNYFSSGSEAALNTSIASAVENGEPWVGYYWEPTWILGKYDMTLLEEEPFDQEKWDDGYGTAFPVGPITVCVYRNLKEEAPDVYAFLENYTTSSEITNNVLAFMQNTDADYDEGALWFIEEYEDLWRDWVPEDIAEKINVALNK